MDSLKYELTRLINSNDDTIVNLKNVLMPIANFIESPLIVEYIVTIVEIMTADRDGNKKLTVDDLRLMVNDPFVIVHLVSSLILILTAIPSLKITVNVDETEIIILKLLMYIFFVIIPSTTGVVWKPEEKAAIVDLSLVIFQTMRSLTIVKNAITKFATYVKNNKYCKCLTVKSSVLDDKVPEVQFELTKAIRNVREKKEIDDKITRLEKMVIQ
jgi:hypothetical protein